MIRGSLSDHLTLHMSASVWLLWRLGPTESSRKADNQGAVTPERCSSLGCWSFVTLLTSGEGVLPSPAHDHWILQQRKRTLLCLLGIFVMHKCCCQAVTSTNPNTIWILMFYCKSDVVAMPTHKRQGSKKVYLIFILGIVYSLYRLYINLYVPPV